jgi:predicted HNH restriction endonuclease
MERFYKIIEDFFGGLKCSRCGYDKCMAALDCHHRDETKKEFEVSKLRTRSESVIKKELAKCDLVCSNCHREIHSGPVA